MTEYIEQHGPTKIHKHGFRGDDVGELKGKRGKL